MTTSVHELDSRRSWAVTAAAALSMFAVFGVGYSFGAFFTSMADEFDASSGATAFVFSVTISLSFVLGLWTGRLADRFGPRPVVLVGAVSLCCGLLLTSRADSIVQGYLSYGIGVGVAIACGYVPMVAMVGGWFDRLRPTALGVAVSGIGIGTLVGAPLAASLIERSGWRTAYVIMGVGGGIMLVLAALVAEPGPAAVRAARPRPLLELLRIREFRILYVSVVFTTFGIFVPFVFLVRYAEDRGVSEVAAASLVGLIGGASVVGRLGLGGLASRLGSFRLYFASMVTIAVSHLIWLAAGASYPLLVLYTLVLGVGYGGFIALSPAVVAEFFGLEGLGGVIGTLYTAAAVGSLGGPPTAGLLIDNFGARQAIAFAATASVLSVVVLWQMFVENERQE